MWTRHPEPERNTDLYVFGYHDGNDRSSADHRQPEQWSFAVLDTTDLANEKSLSHQRVSKLSAWYRIDEVRAEIDRLRLGRAH